MIELHTERLVLRPLVQADLDDLCEYHSHSEAVRFVPWSVRSREEVKEALQNYERCSSALESAQDSLILGWSLKSTQKIIGQSNMALVSQANHTSDLGWITHPEYWRQGYALEAGIAMLWLAFRSFGLHRVIANIDQRNLGSARLAERMGMRCEGIFRQSSWTKGEWCDMWLYAILRDEFLATPHLKCPHLVEC
jgi:RimJ/RimL family protein N-acetyltransferase